MTELERKIEITRPAFDRRDPDPKKDYGIGGVTVRFSVVGPEGAITWGILTDWYLPHVREEFKNKKWFPSTTPTGITIHSPKQLFDFDAESGDCDLLPGGKCYSDTGFLAGTEAFDLLCKEGEEAIWKLLESWYEDQFINKNGDA